MILAVTEKFHDHELIIYYIDTEKLDPKNKIDALILKKSKNKSKRLEIFVDASNEYDDEEPGVTGTAIFKKDPDVIDKVLNLTISFDY